MYRAAGCSSDEEFDSDYGERDKNWNDQIETTDSIDPIVRLRDAARDGRLDEAIDLLQSGVVGPDSKVDGDWTPLMFAASASQPEIVSLLLKSGANPNLGAGLIFPLACACSGSTRNEICNAACVKLLLDAKADPDALDAYGQTSLMKAIKFGKRLVTSLLLPHVDIHIQDTRGRTALFFAVEYDRPEILELLLRNGADLEAVDKRKISLAAVAKQRSNDKILHLLKDVIEDEKEETSPILYSLPADDWRELFPLVAEKNKPLYSDEVAHMLYGMYCEKLAPSFEQNQIGLDKLLSLAEEDMTNLKIDYPYLKKRLLSGLQRFHTYGWKSESISIKKESFDLISCSISIGSHLKHLTIVHASVCFLMNIIEKNMKNVQIDKLELCINNLQIELSNIKEQVQKIKPLIVKINKKNVPSGDFIPAASKQKSLFANKKAISFIAFSLVCTFTIVKFNFR